MKKLKKWLFAVICAICSFCMVFAAACSENGNTSTSDDSSSPTESSSPEETSSPEESSSPEEDGDDDEEEGVISFTQESVAVDLDTSSTTATTLDLTSYLGNDTTVTSITWSSADTDIATVSESGTLTAVSSGSVVITAANSDGTVKATITVVITAYEWVASALDYDAISDYYSDNGMTVGTTKLTSDLTVGIYTIDSGMRLDKSSNILNLNTQGATGVTFTVSGKSNTLSATVRGASSSGDAVFVLYSVADDGTTTALSYSWTAANGTDVEVSVTGLEAGTYYFADTVGYSGRIYDLAVSQYLEVSDVTGITATAGTTDFLVGRDFTYTDLNVVTNYENGSTRVNSNYSVAVYSDQDCATTAATTSMTAGTYYVKVASTIDETEYSDVYTIIVHDISGIELYDYTYTKSGTVTNHLQTIYIQDSGDAFDSTYLSVLAKTEDDDVTFILDESEYTVTQSLDVTKAGAYTVSVSNNIGTVDTETYTVYVVGTITASNATYTIDVDASATLAVDTTANTATFNTVTQALQYLTLIGAGDNYIKTINIAAGSYYEKIFVDMPNVQLIGKGSTYDDVVLWFDLIAGMVEPSGATVYSTDGSASVTASENATGFYATNLTIKNYYNTNTLYKESLTISTDSQAVALLNQADQSYIYNCKITGYHDTLYAQVGRQVYEDCYIEGRTDYIFGYNATAYFNNCEIHTLGAGDAKNGGYVVATKGFITSGTDDITYGYIFNKCDFTADTADMVTTGTADNYVTDGTVSIARAWGNSMSIAVMNSTLSSAYSTEYYGNSTSNKNDRYGIMNASYSLKPSALIEYNNTGAGAVYATADEAAETQNTDEGVTTYTADTTTYTVYNSTTYADTFTLLTDDSEEDAVKVVYYSSLITIFAATNGSMKYSADWSGVYDATRWTVSIYASDGTTKLGEIVVTNGETTAASDILAAISSSLAEGYTLDGVYTDADCTSAYDYAAITADVTLYITAKVKDTSSVSYNVVVDDYTTNTTFTSTMTTTTPIYFNANGTLTTDSTATTGIVSFVGNSKMAIKSSSVTYDSVTYSNCLNIGGGSSSSNGRYFAIDISGLEGYTLSITVVMASGSNETRYAYVYSGDSAPSSAITDMTTTGVEGYATSSSSSTVGGATVTYSVTSSSPDTLYVLGSASIYFYAVLVTVVQS